MYWDFMAKECYHWITWIISYSLRPALIKKMLPLDYMDNFLFFKASLNEVEISYCVTGVVFSTILKLSW